MTLVKAVQHSSRYAVLMGDIVGSESAPSAEELHDTFNQSIGRQNERYKDALASPLTITLGDEFQGLTSSLSKAWPIMRDLRLELLCRSVDCRFAIGSAQLKTPLNPNRAWNMMGPGFAQTRNRLDERRTHTRYNFVFPDAEGDYLLMLDGLGAGLTAIEKRWTKRQLQDIKDSLAGLSAVDIARMRNVTAHSVYKVRASGDFDAYVLQWSAIGAALKRLDERLGMT